LPEWLVERGIGEARAALVEQGRIVEGRIELDGQVHAGTILSARLVSVGVNGRNAVAADGQGREYLLARTPQGITEGGSMTIEVTREAIPGAERSRGSGLAHARAARRSRQMQSRWSRGSVQEALRFASSHFRRTARTSLLMPDGATCSNRQRADRWASTAAPSPSH
jgi:hypothetical protein